MDKELQCRSKPRRWLIYIRYEREEDLTTSGKSPSPFLPSLSKGVGVSLAWAVLKWGNWDIFNIYIISVLYECVSKKNGIEYRKETFKMVQH